MSATIRVDFLGDASSAKRAARETSTATDKLGRDVERNSGKVGKLGTAFGGAVKAYGPLAAIAGAGLVLKLGTDSIRAASEVEQAFGGLDAVFGKQSDTVKQWAADAAENVGLAKSDYASLASTLGASLKNSGIEDYAAKTQDLIGLGADLAATFGGKTSDAVAAISSLLRGETDPIEKYGVAIKQSDVNARLAADGLGHLEGSARTQAEQQTRLKLLFEQTADAQGKFAEESDTLAGSQERLAAKWENLQATLGEKLLPVAEKVVGWLSDTIDGSNGVADVIGRIGGLYQDYLSPILEAASEGWQKLSDKVNEATGRSDGMAYILDKVLDVAEKVAPMLGENVAQKIGWMVDAIIIAIDFGRRLVSSLKWIGDKARWAADKIAEIGSSLSGISESKLARVLDIGSGGFGLLGLFRSSQQWDAAAAGLGRAGGGLAFGGGGGTSYYGPRQVVVPIHLDGREIARETIHVATRAARQEISSQVLTARRARS